jgi:intein/homing endonuclease
MVLAMPLRIIDSGLSERMEREILRSKRKLLTLGKVVKQTVRGYTLGGPVYYQPSPSDSQHEGTFIYGPPGSGKTWVGMLLAIQSFLAENRTWIIIDTKKSVTGDTLIYVRIEGKEKVVTIGELVDEIISSRNINSKESPVDKKIEVLSACDDHLVKWKNVSNVSKHKSPESLLEIKTRSGRKVVATEGHSFLTLENGIYKPIKGSELKVGNFLPVCENIDEGSLMSINATDYFDDKEIIDFDQVQEAVNSVENSVPIINTYKSSGLISMSYGAFIRYVNNERNFMNGTFKCKTKNHSRSSHLQKKIELTGDFGFFCGIFVAEGHAVSKKGTNVISITNYNKTVQERIISWLNELSIQFQQKEKGIVISCLPLTKLFVRWFGDGERTNSSTKSLPDFIFNANKEFLRSFLDGYLSGDGHIRKYPRFGISFSTVSKRLILDLGIIFSKFGMNVRFSREKNSFIGRFSSSDILKFRAVDFTIPDKKERLKEYVNIKGEDAKRVIDIRHILKGIKERDQGSTTGNAIRKLYKKNGISRVTARKIITELENKYPRKASRLKEMVDGDVWWDKIVEIKKEPPSTDFVYDLQVDQTENFMLANGIIVHNSFIGNWRGNLELTDDLGEFGFTPIGIPGVQMDIIAPDYFMQSATPETIRETKVTATYRIPLRLCQIGIMFELTKLRKGAQYASTFEVKFNQLLKETNNNPKMDQFFTMIDDWLEDPKGEVPKNMRFIFTYMKSKIKEMQKFTIDENNKWSAVGNALIRAAIEKKPRWIVFTLCHAQSPQDDVNLALLTAVLSEIKDFAEYARMNRLDIRLGVMIDELHTFVRRKDASSTAIIHDLLFAWGRTSKIWRVFMTQKNEQLNKTFQDKIEDLKLTGTFQKVIKCRAIPEPGYGSMLDRQNAAKEGEIVSDEPRYIDAIKFCPPLMEVESDFPDDEDWRRHMIKKFTGIDIHNNGDRAMREDWGNLAGSVSGVQPRQRQQPRVTIPDLANVETRRGNRLSEELDQMWNGIRSRMRDRR